MEFDAVTIVAQVLNFALILFVLKRFLYRPLITAMDEREATIEERLSEAQELRDEANSKEALFQAKLDEFEQERRDRMEEVRDNVEAENLRLHQELRERVERLETDWRESLKRDAQTQLETYRDELASEILDTVRKALDDLASRDLEHQLIQRFIELIGDLDDQHVEEHLATQSGKLRVVTAHRVEGQDRERLEQALAERFGDTGYIFDTDRGLIAGIELRFAGHRLGWSVDDYLDTLEARMKQRLRASGHDELIATEIDQAWEADDAGSAAS